MTGFAPILAIRCTDTSMEMKGPIKSSHPTKKLTNDSGIACSKPKKCYKYDGKGHFAIVCPTRDQKLALTCENHSNAIEG